MHLNFTIQPQKCQEDGKRKGKRGKVLIDAVDLSGVHRGDPPAVGVVGGAPFDRVIGWGRVRLGAGRQVYSCSGTVLQKNHIA